MSERSGYRWARFAAVGVAGLAVGMLVACSSTRSASTSSADANTSACLSKVDSYLKPWDSLPTTLPAYYTPLSKKPPAGKTIIRLVGQVPSDNDSFGQQQVAAEAIGWQARKVSFDGTVEDLNAKFEQALSEKPAIIALSGWPVASIEKPLADAKRAGVVVVLSSVPDEPSSTSGFAAAVNGEPTDRAVGELNAYLFMRASKCQGSAAIFSLPFPILKVAADSFTSAVHAVCPKCKVSYNEVQTKDIGTPAVTNAIVSKLQSSPSVKYLYTIIGNVATGVDTALSQAGISGVRIFGQVPDDNAIKALRQGTNAWWVDTGGITAWVEFDAALRAIDAGRPVADGPGHYPLAVLTPKNVPDGTGVPVFPVDYRAEFENLWSAG